jgi:hypothetical protein
VLDELSALYRELEQRDRHLTVDGSMVKQLLEAAKAIEAMRGTAASMQLGAEGFDNTQAARLYSTVQEHLVAAAKELLRASQILAEEAKSR